MKPSGHIYWADHDLWDFMADHCKHCMWFDDDEREILINRSCAHPCAEVTASASRTFRWPVDLAMQITQDGIDYTDDGNPFCHWFTPTQEESQ